MNTYRLLSTQRIRVVEEVGGAALRSPARKEKAAAFLWKMKVGMMSTR